MKVLGTVVRTVAVGLGLALAGGPVLADNQTPTVSPVSKNASELPFKIALRPVETPSPLPTLQSFASGQSGGLWVIIGGRTNGLHNFSDNPLKNFPPRRQNDRIWVIDPTTWKFWSRPLDDSKLTEDQVDQLSSTATESVQIGDTLYVVGGYGYSRRLSDFTTYSTMTAFDLTQTIRWVKREGKWNGKGDLAGLIRQTSHSALTVTGGQLTMLGKRAILAFGQNFQGGYGGEHHQNYSMQVRSFDIVDDGETLSIRNVSRSPSERKPDKMRRRDYNLVPLLDRSGNKETASAAALAGVFTKTNGIFTVPVEINGGGRASMADPSAPSTFKQAMSGYNCAVLPIYDAKQNANHNVLFGGISYVSYNRGTGKFVEDSQFPFINDVTVVVRNEKGKYQQVLASSFPNVQSADGKRLRFGAEAGVFIDPATPLTKNGMVDLETLARENRRVEVVVGRVFGGIAADAGNNGSTVASNLVFEIVVTPR